MPPSFSVASTKPEAALARGRGWQPWQERGWALAPRDRGAEAGMYCWMGHLGCSDRLARRDLAGPCGVHELADRRLRRADRAQAECSVEVGPRRIEDAHDDTLVVEALHRNLRDDEVRVVSVGGDDDRVGVLDPRLAQDVDVHPMAHHEAAAPVLAE